MMLVMALNSVAVFTLEKTLQIHVNVCDTVQILGGILPCICGMLEEAGDLNVFLLESIMISSSV